MREGTVGAIIQARMASTRLPGKTLMEIGGKPLLQHVVEAAQKAFYVEKVVVATTWLKENKPLIEWAESNNVLCFIYNGPDEDTMARTLAAAKAFHIDHIVRVTPDCPLLEPERIGYVVGAYLCLPENYDYVSNLGSPDYIDGLDVEVFSREALEKAFSMETTDFEKEHSTQILRKSGWFKACSVPMGFTQPWIKLSVDTDDDLEFVRAVYRRMGR